jgi:hypothetical protein
MILKEIEMDLPYVRDIGQAHLSSEAIKMDYELNWKAKRRQFQLMTRCMTSMLERIVPRIITKDCWKILIECVEVPSRRDCINLLGVYSIQVHFDINMFWEMNNLEKKKYVVKKIGEAIGKIAQYNLFATEEIQKACSEIVDSHYVNEWYWDKPVKLKQMSVQVKILHEIERVNIYMVFKDSIKNTCKEKLLVSEIPDERAYSKYLGKLEWISVGIARLSTKNGEVFIETSE